MNRPFDPVDGSPTGSSGMRPREHRRRGWRQEFYRDLNEHIRKFNSRRARRGGETGKLTQRHRIMALEKSLRRLLNAGYKLRRLNNFGLKHMQWIVNDWRARDLNRASTMQNYFSHFRKFCMDLGKPQLARYLDEEQAGDPLMRRSTYARTDHSEQARGLDVHALFKQAHALNPWFAAQLMLIFAFGLRASEAMQFRPHLAERSDGLVLVLFGTKGGRPRVLPFELTEFQRSVLQYAKTFPVHKAESMIPADYSLKRWRRRFYDYCERVGLTRDQLGVTPHSLRHGYLLDNYEEIAGEAAPVRGGGLARVNPCADRAVREVIALLAGHTHPSITTAYLGPVNPNRLLS